MRPTVQRRSAVTAGRCEGAGNDPTPEQLLRPLDRTAKLPAGAVGGHPPVARVDDGRHDRPRARCSGDAPSSARSGRAIVRRRRAARALRPAPPVERRRARRLARPRRLRDPRRRPAGHVVADVARARLRRSARAVDAARRRPLPWRSWRRAGSGRRTRRFASCTARRSSATRTTRAARCASSPRQSRPESRSARRSKLANGTRHASVTPGGSRPSRSRVRSRRCAKCQSTGEFSQACERSTERERNSTRSSASLVDYGGNGHLRAGHSPSPAPARFQVRTRADVLSRRSGGGKGAHPAQPTRVWSGSRSPGYKPPKAMKISSGSCRSVRKISTGVISS
jgi:hypothetical protein